VKALAERRNVQIEFQRLHGMGEALYEAANRRYNGVVLRAYAPVGGHEDLLPYLVRRLLENGANTSFVHALLDERVPAERVVQDPIGLVQARPGPHPRIPLPADIYGDREKFLGRRPVFEGRGRAAGARRGGAGRRGAARGRTHRGGRTRCKRREARSPQSR
jgi:RHH-type proline utilization regulon transcriptional repressor/proline dehydrogenase/delta 1-pyrroline-5-carboxylate dehydrogenase